MYTFTGDNPSVLQVKSFFSVLEKGSEVKPRGKRIKELRPSTFEFQNPYRRFTFMRGRKVNPFFTLAESLWIISGRSDVQFLDAFNKNMKSFSDDGQFFNASYGERLRAWGSNKLHEQLYNPVDQMYDAYYKLKEDPDTRQAVMVISNPHFDNSRYTVLEKGRDIACLTGDTIIASPEGDLPLKELVEKENYPVYSYNEKTGEIEIKPIVAGGMTRRNAKLLKITLGDGTELKVTPDHLCYRKVYETNMVTSPRGFKYPVNKYLGMEMVQAEDLEIGDRLPYLLRFTEKNGYTVLNKTKLSKSIEASMNKEHIMYMEYLLGRKLGEKEVVHHKNAVKTCNMAENLQVLDTSVHSSLDMENNKRQAGHSKKRTPAELLTKENLFDTAVGIIESGTDLTIDTFKNAFEGVGCLNACKRAFGCFTNLKKSAYAFLGKDVPNGLGGSTGDSKSTVIVNIEECENEDVYDITVEDNHNFFANGYLVHNCNLVITFKIREGKLHMTVFNRSNDHCYGLFGANLCQFTTIMETMSAWLGLPCGTYTHITDSLHLYLDDYGSKTNQEILDEHKSVHSDTKDADLEEDIYFETDQEPRMSLDYQGTNEFLSVFWGVPAAILVGDNTKSILELAEFVPKITKDTYWQNAIYSMIVYRLVRLGNLQDAMLVLHDRVVPYSGKVSMLYFLKDRVYASGVPEIIKSYEDDVAKIKTHLINSEEAGKSLEKYLLK